MTNFSSTPPPPPPPAPIGMSTSSKPERPAVSIGAALMILGGALMIVGSMLSWFEFEGDSLNGFSSGGGDGSKDGPFFSVIGGIAIVFGFIQLASKKVLALGIIAVATSAFGLLAAIVDLGDVNDAVDIGKAFAIDASTGPGLFVVIGGAALAIVGSIATIAKRRV